MSGHSKWATIKHKKGAVDAKRGQLFSKLIKEITVAARLFGGDENANARLRNILLKARAANMPRENIERAIKKGCGNLDGIDYSEMQYEAYAPGGVGLLIEVLTDNKNRSASDVRSVLNRYGGSLASSGAVSFQFNRRGMMSYDLTNTSFDALLEAAIDVGAIDVEEDGTVLTEAQDFEVILTALKGHGFEAEAAEVTMVADNLISLEQQKTAKVLRLIDKLEECDDVQSVASNLNVPIDFEMDE